MKFLRDIVTHINSPIVCIYVVCVNRRLDTWCQFLKRWITSCMGQSWQLCYCSRCRKQQQVGFFTFYYCII